MIPGIIHHYQGRSPRSADAVFFSNSVPYLYTWYIYVVRCAVGTSVPCRAGSDRIRAKFRAVTSKVSFGHDAQLSYAPEHQVHLETYSLYWQSQLVLYRAELRAVMCPRVPCLINRNQNINDHITIIS